MKRAKCVGCANCCKTTICLLGKLVHGEETAAPCPSLRHRKSRYWCHLVEVGLPPEKAVKTDQGKVSGGKSIAYVKDQLEIGTGCPEPHNGRRKKHVFKSQISQIATRIELGVRGNMMTDGEYSDQAQEDKDAIYSRWQALKEDGKDFYEAIKQARLEFIENVLTDFVKEMAGADLRNSNSGKDEKSGKTESETETEKNKGQLPVLVGSGNGSPQDPQ